ncbi:hypothetical protein L2D14_10780 [Thalassospiraceae bacterium LMO-JJ14]|nr:hypothetical protein L2D14_10780 [Thalassospiraceae bacterium LMO-JJ14]
MNAQHSGSQSSPHAAYSNDDMLKPAEAYLKTISSLNRLWAEKNGVVVMTAMTMLYRSARQGYETDITAFAAAMSLPRTSAHRMLHDWEKKEYVRLERKGRKTTIHLTEQTLEKLMTFFNNPASIF